MKGLAAYVKHRFLKEPEHPGSVGFFAFALLVGCLLVAIGLFTGSRGLLVVMWVALGLFYVALGVAESLPVRHHRTVVALRITSYLVVLAIVLYVLAATVTFDV